MIGYGSGKGFAALAITAMAGMSLSSCTVPADIALSSTGEPVASISSVSMTLAEDDGAMRGEYAAALRSALQEYSVAIADDAPLILEYSISQRDAETGIADTPPPGSADVSWQSEKRKSRLFDGCDVRRVRAGLLLVERASGKVAYRGTADMDACASSQPQVAQLASALVEDALTQGIAPER